LPIRDRKGSVALVKSIVQHKHCVECRKVCSPEKDTCSEECEAEHKKTIRRKKMYIYFLFAMMAVFISLYIIQLTSR
jgi:predicted nucleic acid-binding Zn ribbon protein